MVSKTMSLQDFHKFMMHLSEASKLVTENIPSERIESMAYFMNATQACQWVRNFRETQAPKDFVMNQDEAKRTLRTAPQEVKQ